MKLLVLISVAVTVAVGEVPAPYPASGWRPSGPAFELPQKSPLPQTKSQEYLPPFDPRTGARGNDFDSEGDISVQSLPTQEQQPIFQISPVNGQQYVGQEFNTDIRNLNERYRQNQFQAQQETARQFAKQRQLDTEINSATSLPNPQIPNQFVPRTTPRPTETIFTTPRFNDFTTQTETTTELVLNEGETVDDSEGSGANGQKEKVSVEVSKLNLQEFPAELYLSPLAQYRFQQVQPQLVPLQQFGQIRAPLIYQPVQELQKAGFDGSAHFSALPSVLAQRQLLAGQQQSIVQTQQGFIQNPAPQPNMRFVVLDQSGQTQAQRAFPQFQAQPVILPQQNQVNQYGLPREIEEDSKDQRQLLAGQQQSVVQSQQGFIQNPALQPNTRFFVPDQSGQIQSQQAFPQFQAQPVILPQQNQVNQYGLPRETEEDSKDQPQYVYQQYQPQGYDQSVPPGQANQQEQLSNFNQDVQQYYQNLQQQQLQLQLLQQQQVQFDQAQVQTPVQGQDAFLQSGVKTSQRNDIEQNKEESEENPDEGTASAVATAFGTRNQPRPFNQYGSPVPRVQANPEAQATETPLQDDASEEGPAIASATAVVRSNRRQKSAKLRNRRIRPVFTLDKSGHLVLAQDY